MPRDDEWAGSELLGAALGDLYRVLRRSVNRRAGRTALPDAQIEVLRLVQRQPGISVKEAADRLRTAANTVSTLVGDLVAAGLLDREPDPANRRVARLRLTPAARDRLTDYDRRRADLLLAALHRLAEPDRTGLLAAAPALRALADAVADEDHPADRGPAVPPRPWSAGRDGAGGSQSAAPAVTD